MSSSSTPAPRLIWYQLIDADTGQPFRGTSADYVSLPSSHFVAQFRDAVHGKNPKKLSSVDASDLLVYKNQDSFDNRHNANENEGKVGPLKSSTVLNNLGDTEDEALIVVVPVVSYGKGADTITPVIEFNPAIELEDISVSLYEVLTQPFPNEPSVEELNEFLSAEPLVKIPLCSNRYQNMAHSFAHPGANQFKSFFYHSTTKDFGLANLLEEIPKMNLNLGPGGESSIIFYVDFFLRRILSTILESSTLHIDVYRNMTDFSNTTQKMLRPDFLFYANSFLILRGEEKKSKGYLSHAKDELLEKLSYWNSAIFGSLKYIFGYVCAGESFQLCAITSQGQLVDISKVFNLENVIHRYELFFRLINLARVINTIRHRFPTPSIKMYQRNHRPNGVTIVITEKEVVKTIPVSQLDQKNRFQFLRELYAAMLSSQVPFVVKCMSIHKRSKGDDRFIQLKLQPLGNQTFPGTLALLLAALRCVLLALEGIHQLGYAHCDVRWPNLLCVSDENWILIDFENAVKDNAALFKDDVRMVGELIFDTVYLPPNSPLYGFRSELLSESRPDASGALELLSKLSV